MLAGLLAIPLAFRRLALAALGACAGSLINLAAYRLAWTPRAISPRRRGPMPASAHAFGWNVDATATAPGHAKHRTTSTPKTVGKMTLSKPRISTGYRLRRRLTIESSRIDFHRHAQRANGIGDLLQLIGRQSRDK